MMKALKIAVAAIVGIVAVTLLILRTVGLDPGYTDPRSEEFARNNMIARPGVWLSGDVVKEPVKDWSFVQEELRGKKGKDATIQVETRTRYFVPHSVTVGGDLVRDGKLYVHAHSDPNRMSTPFRTTKLGRVTSIEILASASRLPGKFTRPS